MQTGGVMEREPDGRVGEAAGREPARAVRSRGWRWQWVCVVAGLVVLALAVKFVLHLVLPRNFAGTGEHLQIEVARQPFEILYYCGPEEPKGVVVLGTGDGGWSYWEERTAKHLAKQGYAVAGWDCRKFADSRSYDQAALAEGFRRAAEAAAERAGEIDGPVWYGGWSTGAEQSVAAAASEDRAPTLVGLLLAAPGQRGRFGITTSDLLGVTPSGPGSFALADFGKRLEGVAVAQFAAGMDPLDDVDWLKAAKVPCRVFELPRKLHDMGGAGDEFLATMDEAMRWTLERPKAGGGNGDGR